MRKVGREISNPTSNAADPVRLEAEDALWSELFEREWTVREAIVGGDADGRSPTDAQRREWWSIVAQMLDLYVRREADPRFRSFSPPPLDMLASLGGVATALAETRGRGRGSRGATESADIGWATAYLQLVEVGKIADATPTKTVQELYHVTRTTAQSWRRLPIPSSVESKMTHVEGVALKMAKAGARYSRIGRSASALISRNRNRPVGR